MHEELTEPDEQISADKMETLSLDLLSALPMEGVEGSPLDADVIWKIVERAATDATSVHHVVENTDETPDDDETIMDWLRTIEPDALEEVVNDLLAEHATTILDPDSMRIPLKSLEREVRQGVKKVENRSAPRNRKRETLNDLSCEGTGELESQSG